MMDKQTLIGAGALGVIALLSRRGSAANPKPRTTVGSNITATISQFYWTDGICRDGGQEGLPVVDDFFCIATMPNGE